MKIKNKKIRISIIILQLTAVFLFSSLSYAQEKPDSSYKENLKRWQSLSEEERQVIRERAKKISPEQLKELKEKSVKFKSMSKEEQDKIRTSTGKKPALSAIILKFCSEKLSTSEYVQNDVHIVRGNVHIPEHLTSDLEKASPVTEKQLLQWDERLSRWEKSLLEREKRIKELATYQLPEAALRAHTIAKDFNRGITNPQAAVDYTNLPPL